MLDEPVFRAPGYHPGFRGARATMFDDPFFQNTRPAVDVSEDNGKYIVEAEVPGVKKDALEIRPAGTTDTTAVTKAPDAPNQLSTERTVFGNFTRTVWLPRPVDASKVSAKLNDGILTVTVPKAEDHGSTVIKVE
ncbi:HSP20-like chaperone [Schizophyllum fasciatum]